MKHNVIEFSDVWKKYKLGQYNAQTFHEEVKALWTKLVVKNSHSDDDIKQNGEFYALKGLNLEIEEGEIHGIIGKNGAGKSTLLKLLSRITSPTRGQIRIKGKVSSLLEVGTGFHPELTGKENIFLNGAIMGMSRKEIKIRLSDIIDFSDCGEFIDTPVKRYSSGMLVRLGFSVAAHLESDIMIVDEVLAVGDQNFQDRCIEKLNFNSKDLGKTILFVSHNLGTVRSLCETGSVISNGKAIRYDSVIDAIDGYAGGGPSILSRNYPMSNSYPTITEISIDKNLLSVGTIAVKLKYFSKKPFKPIPGISIYDSNKEPVVGTNGRAHNTNISINETTSGEFTCTWSDIPLHSGVYNLSAWLGGYNQDHEDEQRHTITFDFVCAVGISRKPNRHFGSLNIPPKWEHDAINT